MKKEEIWHCEECGSTEKWKLKKICKKCANKKYGKKRRKTIKYKLWVKQYYKKNGKFIYKKRKKYFQKYVKTKKHIEYNKKWLKSKKGKKWRKQYIKEYIVSGRYNVILNKWFKTKKGQNYLKRRSKSKYFIEYHKKYEKKRRENPLYRFSNSLRTLIRWSLISNGYSKKSHTFEIIGLSFDDFKKWIENQFMKGMTWDNFGRKGWSIDHYIPISYAKTKEEVMMLNNYKNLRPMWFIENISKGNNLPNDYQEKLKELGWYCNKEKTA